MIRALIWKEYREQRAIWLTLAVVSGAGLFGLSRLMAPDGILASHGARESLQAVAVLFAWTYGLVCGAMLLANENESGTMTFLDILPTRRMELWLVKCLFGLFLLLMQVAVLTGLVVGLGIVESTAQLLATLVVMLVFGLIAMSWSLLFSAFGDNVLNVIGFSFVGQIVSGLVALILLAPAVFLLTMLRRSLPNGGEIPRLILLGFGLFGLIVGPVFGSARLFTRLDRQRARAAKWAQRPTTGMSVWASWVALLWLSYVQMRRLLLGLLIVSLPLGLMLPLFGPAGWPILTLLLGVVCGVTVWSDEQMSASFRFLGDQRFPLGRVWIVKVGMRFALAVFAAFLLLLPSLVLATVHHFESEARGDRLPFTTIERLPFFADLLHCSLVGPIVPVWANLSIWLLYGFTSGHLCGMLFRKSLVAAVVAFGSSATMLCMWLPSLVGIGLHFWQVAGAPLVLLLAGWLLMPAWTADRLLARDTIVRLGALLLAAALWIAGGLYYRVAEIPDLPDTFDMPAFAASIPSRDLTSNRAGVEIHAAWHEVEQLTRELRFNNAQPNRPLFPKQPASNTFQEELLWVYSKGWPADRPSDLGDKLDAEFQKEWYSQLRKAADSPLGVVEDAKQLTLNSRIGEWHVLTYLNEVLAVRGLQMQARGDHSAFVQNLRIGLALSRNLQNRAPPALVEEGRRAELVCFNALDRWLEKLPGHPELLERARDILLQHMAQMPMEIFVLKASYLIAQNTLEQMPVDLVEREIRLHRLGQAGQVEPQVLEDIVDRDIRAPKDRKQGVSDLQTSEMDLVALLWRIPWEHERHQRILRVVFEGNPLQPPEAKKWGGSALSSLSRKARKVMPREDRVVASLFAAQLKVAVRLYMAEKGKYPDRLDDLGAPRWLGREVHRLAKPYLPAIPLDPFNTASQFHYRLVRGKHGEPDKAVLWSVGEDRHDDGGIRQGIQNQVTAPGEDLIYIVPPPPR